MKFIYLSFLIFLGYSTIGQTNAIQLNPKTTSTKSTSKSSISNISHSPNLQLKINHNGDTLIWYKRGYVVKNQKIVLLNRFGNNYKKYNRTKVINDIKSSYANKLKIDTSEIKIIRACDCDDLLLLKGTNLHTVSINSDPGNGSAGNGFDGNNNEDEIDGGSLVKKTDTFSKRQPTPPDTFGCKEKPIRVAILDTGLDITETNFNKSSFFSKKDLLVDLTSDEISGLNFTSVQGRYNISDISDASINRGLGHGTLVTKIISDNMSNIKILPMKIMNGTNGTLFDALCALLFAYNNDFQVINCSWGHKGEKNLVFEKVIHLLKGKNITLIASAGNDDSNLAEGGKSISHYPAMFSHNNSNVIGVTCDTGNYSPIFISIKLQDKDSDDAKKNIALRNYVGENNTNYTSYSAAYASRLFLSIYPELIQKRAFDTSTTSGNIRSIKYYFYRSSFVKNTGDEASGKTSENKYIPSSARIN